MRSNETKNEIDEIKKCEEKIKQKDLKYETRKDMNEFQQYETTEKVFILIKLI